MLSNNISWHTYKDQSTMTPLNKSLLFLSVIIPIMAVSTTANEISSNTRKEKTDREKLGFSNEVKRVVIDDGYNGTRYAFDREGNLVYEHNREGRHSETIFNRYQNGLVTESYQMTAYNFYKTYKYNENKQLIEILCYDFAPIDFGPDLKMYNPYSDKDVDEDKLKLKYINDENMKYKIQFFYNSNGQRKKSIENKVNYNPMSRSAFYGRPSGSTTKYYYNNQGLLSKEVTKERGGSRWEQLTEHHKYDKNKNLVYSKFKSEENWFILFRKVNYSEDFYFYDDQNRLIKTYRYRDSKPEKGTHFKEYLYDTNGKLAAKIIYHLEENQYAILDPEREVNKGKSRHIQIITRVSDYDTYGYDAKGNIKSSTQYTVRFNQESAKPDNILEYNHTHFDKGINLGTTIYKYNYHKDSTVPAAP
jgi:hypothetical protein